MSDPSPQQPQLKQPLESPLPPPQPPPPFQQQAGGVVISFEQITKLFSVPIAEAAAKLGVCTSVLKRKCREHGLPKWPYRKVHAGKSVEDIKKEANIEKDSKLAKQRIDSSSMSASIGTQGRTATQNQENSKFSSVVSNQQGNKLLQSEKTNMTQSSHPRSIPNYFDEFKYGFPASGLSSATHKWWGTGENEPDDKALDKEVDPEDKEHSIAVDSKDGKSENSDIVSQPVTKLTSLRKKAVHEGRESLKLGVSKDYASLKLSKRKKLVLLQVFQSSLPNEWKDSFCT